MILPGSSSANLASFDLDANGGGAGALTNGVFRMQMMEKMDWKELAAVRGNDARRDAHPSSL